jgi:WD40 repeat protein
MVPKIGPCLRGRWAAGCLLAAGSVLAVLPLRPSRSGLERPPSILLGSHRHPVQCLAFAPDGKTLASGGGRPHLAGEVKLWDLAAGAARAALTDRHGVVYSLAFAPDGRTLAAAGLGPSVRLWDGTTGVGRPGVQTASMPVGASVQVAFSPDGQALALAGLQHEIRLRSLATGLERVLPTGCGPAAFSPDGRRLAFVGFDSRPGGPHVLVVKVWDLTAERELVTLRGHAHFIWSLCYSPDGRLLASGGQDGTARLWDAATGRARAVLRGHTGDVNAVAFSPDGRVLASGGHDRAVRLWDPLTGQERAALRGHTGAVTAVAFSPDGRHVASGSYDTTVRLWPVGACVQGR